MKFELRNVSHNERLSEETHAYAADLYVSGSLMAFVSNQGHGGCDMVRPAPGYSHADIEKLEAYAKTLPVIVANFIDPATGKPFEMPQTLETICGDLLENHLAARDMRRTLKRTIAFIDPAKKGVQIYKGKHVGVERAHLCTHTTRKIPGAIILNNLPEPEALKLWRQHSAG